MAINLSGVSVTGRLAAGSLGAPVVSDEFFQSVSLLLHADGTQGSNAFVDNSPRPKTVTTAGDTFVSNSIKKYGTGSAYFDGNDYLSIANNQEFNFTTGSFTVEMWVNASAFPGSAQAHLFSTTISGGFGVYIKPAGSVVVAKSGVVELLGTPGGALTLNNWHHVAVSKDDQTMRIFVDGVLSATLVTAISFAVDEIRVGHEVTSGFYNGYIDDLRVTKGVARYTDTFVPPAAAFPNQ